MLSLEAVYTTLEHFSVCPQEICGLNMAMVSIHEEVNLVDMVAILNC